MYVLTHKSVMTQNKTSDASHSTFKEKLIHLHHHHTVTKLSHDAQNICKDKQTI